MLIPPRRNSTKPAALYARVSTPTQDVAGQVERLTDYATRAGYNRQVIFADVSSGRDLERPSLSKMLEAVNGRRVSVVVVESLDRLGRSLRDVVFLLERFSLNGVDFASIRETVDTSSASGRFFFYVVSALAELEREIISERVRAGLESARARGAELGRPCIPQETVAEIHELRAGGNSIRSIARLLELSTATVKKYLKTSRKK